MQYCEREPSRELCGFIKAFWTLEGCGGADERIEHQATPDGCVELICRVRGRSWWGGDQPERFAVGLSQSPISFAISGDAEFMAVRLWPWAWNLISEVPLRELAGTWRPATGKTTERICLALPDFGAVEHIFLECLDGSSREIGRVGLALIGSASVAEMCERAGMGERRLQRWFGRHVGMAPRNYLRLLRFQSAFEDLPQAGQLADHAARHGFADQAHMAREFRKLAGQPASRARDKSTGPFFS